MFNQEYNNNVIEAETFLENLVLDFVMLGLRRGRLHVLLAKRIDDGGTGEWMVPGGNIFETEELDQAAVRVVKEISGVDALYIDQLKVFGGVDRVQAKRTLSIAHIAVLAERSFDEVIAKNPSQLQWWPADNLPQLAFDHASIVRAGLSNLRHKVRFEPVCFKLLPEKFTLLQLQELYESVLHLKVDKPNFRRKVMNMKLLISCNEKQKNVAHRAATLYRFDFDRYNNLMDTGYLFHL